MDIRTAFVESSKKLNSKENESANLEAEIFLSFVLRKPREFLFTHPETKLSFWQKLKLNSLISQRLKGVPVAYLTGHKEFYDLDFIVNKNVLIPRPETELIVDEVLKTIINYQLSIRNFIDIGTGSGCIAISLVKKFQEKKILGSFYGLDISRKALQVAKKNAKKNDVDGCIHFLYSNLLNSIEKNIFSQPVIITANLPYLTPEQVKNSPTIKNEPKIALLSGIDGLEHYRRLFEQVDMVFKEFGQEIIIFCEIDETQAEKIKEMAANCFSEPELEIVNDLHGLERLVKIRIYRKA
jgi:release factor glutamine methyltransferase